MQDTFQIIIDEINSFYNEIRDIPVQQSVTREQIQHHLQHTYGDFSSAIPVDKVITDVIQMLREWTVHVTHPQYFGLFNPSVHHAGIYADTLTAAFNPQLAAWSHAPAANEIERTVLEFFMTRLGFDRNQSIANFTTGGAEANLSALTTALTHTFEDYGDHGAPRNAVFYGSEESHGSLKKMAHQTGIGRSALRTIPTNQLLQMDTKYLLNQITSDIKQGFKPFMVIATAGTTAAGVIDPLTETADICSEHNLWFHIDAAWGGAGILSPELRQYYTGIDRADSITWDAHKWLSVPMGAGMFFCKHRQSVERTYSIDATYMPSKTQQTTDPYVTSMQWSRRFIGLKVFLTLATLGEAGFEKHITNQAKLGESLRQKLTLSGWKLINNTPLPVVCFSHDFFEKDPNLLDKCLDHIYEQNNVWLSKVLLASKIVGLRACITSFRTNEDDLDLLVQELNSALEAI